MYNRYIPPGRRHVSARRLPESCPPAAAPAQTTGATQTARAAQTGSSPLPPRRRTPMSPTRETTMPLTRAPLPA